MRLGIFGGSFDPIHYGHLILAEHCREQAELDEVWFVPSATAPHKQDGAQLSKRQRMELVELAIRGHPAFRVSNMELERGGISYTVDTLNQIREERPEDELFFLMGADSLGHFASWKEPTQICELALPLVVNRPGADDVDLEKLRPFVGDSRMEALAAVQIQSPLIEISSSEIRRRVGAGESIRYLLPRSVEKYIEAQKLYQLATAEGG